MSPPRWISTHPAVLKNQYSPSGFPRSHPMYWTLPSRRTYEEPKASDYGRMMPSVSSSSSSSNPPVSNPALQRSSQINGAGAPEFLSSTPTKADRPAAANPMNGMSPILKENFLSPKTKMTSEEIFTAIHKSKKKLIMRDDSRSESPAQAESPVPEKARERSSWSPNSCEVLDANRNEPRTRKSWNGAGTPINTFKKLLLQHGIKSSKDNKMSAVEQLKLSRTNANSPARQEATKAPRSILNGRGRGQWRFSSPRTDILSSTIPEDCNEVEKQEETPPKKDGSKAGTGKVPPTSDSEEEQRRSFEITKKSLQEARKNFFSETKTSPQSEFRTSLFGRSPQKCGLSSPQNGHKTGERRRASIISLETAL